MHSFEVGIFNALDINEFTITPESNFGDFVCRGVDAEVDGFPRGGMVHFKGKVIDGDSSIGIDGSVHSEAEDILYGLIRGFDCKFSE